MFIEDTLDEVLNGFSFQRIMTCPCCEAIIDFTCQELESDSDFYLCANCGFKLPRKSK